uniref:Uncharacterized protein n=1 Tax=Timema douglasi TaxID=61478 RepID=A0A7R8VHI3_TIMDO|nr:unnamed protein product [Timema douglasi]
MEPSLFYKMGQSQKDSEDTDVVIVAQHVSSLMGTLGVAPRLLALNGSSPDIVNASIFCSIDSVPSIHEYYKARGRRLIFLKFRNLRRYHNRPVEQETRSAGEFLHQQSDKCSVCLQLLERTASAKDEAANTSLTIELRAHKARAKALFELLRGKDPSKLIL